MLANRIDDQIRDKVIFLSAHEGKGPTEIAASLGISISSVCAIRTAYNRVASGDWEGVKRMVRKNSSLSLFVWAASCAGCQLPEDVKTEYQRRRMSQRRTPIPAYSEKFQEQPRDSEIFTLRDVLPLLRGPGFVPTDEAREIVLCDGDEEWAEVTLNLSSRFLDALGDRIVDHIYVWGGALMVRIRREASEA